MYQYPYMQSSYLPQAPKPQTNVQWVYVNGFDGARSQIVQPGNTAWMMDNNDSIIYVKTVDTMGTAVLKGFRLTEISQQTQDPPAEHTQYAKQTDMDSILKRLTALENEIGGLNT